MGNGIMLARVYRCSLRHSFVFLFSLSRCCVCPVDGSLRSVDLQREFVTLEKTPRTFRRGQLFTFLSDTVL